MWALQLDGTKIVTPETNSKKMMNQNGKITDN
jgi:hypothetical protein